MNQLEVFKTQDNYTSFEDFQKENGDSYWLATDLMGMLGYKSFQSFKKSVNKAMSACSSLNITITDNFREVMGDKGRVNDYRLTRFACYLTAMNSDVRKREVAAAQAYFITLAEAFKQYIQEAEDVERILIRDEISDHDKTLTSVANQAGVIDFALFKNAGYRGMYNMNLRRLKKYKGISKEQMRKSLLDFMGREELAANLFRITQTESKIVNDRIQGQKSLEKAAFDVGRKVRKTIGEISGHKPEDLAISDDIKEVRKGLKRTQKEFVKLDKPKKNK